MFNATVCNNSASSIDKVFFEWNMGPNVSVTENFTLNESCSVFSTIKTDLPANESGWAYKWFANNTAAENATLTDNYTIVKGNPLSISYIKLYIDNETSNKSISYPSIAEIRGNTTLPGSNDVTLTLYRNASVLGYGNSTNQTVNDTRLGNGTYVFVYNTSGGQNWTSGSVSLYLYVNKGALPLHLYLNGTEGNKINSNSYDFNGTANFSVILNTTSVPYLFADNTTYLYSNFTNWTVKNSSNSTFFNYTINLNRSGLFYLTANWGGDENYSSNTTTYYFGVTPYFANNATSVASGSNYSSGRNYSFSIKIVGNITNVIFESDFLNGYHNYTNVTPVINISNDTLGNYWINFTDLTANESYKYRWYANDTDGNQAQTELMNYNITKFPVALVWAAPASWAFIAGTTVTVTCTSDPDLNLSLGVTGFPQVYSSSGGLGTVSTSVPSSASASFSCLCNPKDSTNYSGSINHLLDFTIASVTTTTTSSGTPTGSFLIKDLVSSLAANTSRGTSTSFTISNTLANNMVNVTVSVIGIPSSWYTLSKNIIQILGHGTTDTITITLNIPADAELRDYDVTIISTGRALGETSTRTSSKTMKLTVLYGEPEAILPLDIVGALETSAEISNNDTESTASNQSSNVTGLVATFEYLQDNLLLVIAVIACVLIFFFRNDVNIFLKREARVVRREEKKLLPSVKNKFNYKLSIDIKKVKTEPKKTEEKKSHRPESLEREIKRDINELRSILDAEKKISKKKSKLENN